MTRADRTQAERAVAFLVEQIRPDWAQPGVLAVLRKTSQHDLPEVIAAALDCAVRRTDQRTPAIIAESGAHWQALARITERRPVTEPGIITRCPHGRPTDTLCAECSGDALGVPMPADLRARYRAARDAPTEGVES